MIVTIICQVINLCRDILLARSFGTSSLNDVYLISQTIVSVLITMINSPMATAFVPVATKYYVSESIEKKNIFISKIYSDAFIVSIVMLLIEVVGIDLIVFIAAPGLSSDSQLLLKIMVLIQAPITVVNIIRGINRGNFQILQKFYLSELTGVFPYVCMCIYLIIPVTKSIYMIAIILSVATCLSVIPEFIVLNRNGFRFKFSVGLNNDIKTMLILMSAAAITTGIREVNVLFDKTIGSLLPTGSITMLSYASKLTVVVVGLVTASISLVGFTNVAKLRNEGKKQEVLDSIVESCNLINFLIIPISIFIIVYANDIIKFLYFRGGFDLESVATTSVLMRLYALGLVGYGFQDVYTRTLHAYKIVRCTVKESALMVTLNIVLNLLLYKKYGAYGVALATSISILAVIPILGNDVKKNIGDYNRRLIISEMFKIYIISIIAGVISIGVRSIIPNNSFIVLLFGAVIYFAIYFSICFLTKNKVLKNLVLG